MAELNSPLKIGDFEIKNRLVMAPLTRARSGETVSYTHLTLPTSDLV